eukprot:gb/GEZN01003287.1/.p1 GENE.gb/GEZN01003287.1/~~gb/GEZN01003287.1/.p1  ORF type:complete len:608 (-),score=63.63 gb/GEZN01003287.1/:64-1887(-)
MPTSVPAQVPLERSTQHNNNHASTEHSAQHTNYLSTSEAGHHSNNASSSKSSNVEDDFEGQAVFAGLLGPGGDRPGQMWLSLFVSFVCTAFGPGLQCIPSLAFLQPVFLLHYCWLAPRNCRTCYLALAWLTQSFGMAVAYAGMFKQPQWNFHGLKVVFLVTSASTLFMLPPYALDLHAARVFKTPYNTLVFPTAYTAALFVLSELSPVGSWGHPAYSQISNQSIAQLFSLASLSGVLFLLAYAACVLQQVLVYGVTSPISMRAAYPCLIVWSLFLLVGGSRVPLFGGHFFQRSIEDTLPSKVSVACLLDQEDSEPDMLLRRTKQMLDLYPSIRLILWAETAVLYKWDLLVRARHLASTHQTYLGVTYLETLNDTATPNQRNMFTFISPEGHILFHYQKAHPVVLGVEPNTIPGVNEISFVDTPDFGRVGGAICFDYDFPSFLHQASVHSVDVMLQPSWTWGPLGALHSQMDRVRAIENGFTLVRCSSGGTSGVYSPYGETLLTSEDANTGGFLGDVPLGPRVFTFFGVFGNTLAWCCVGFSVFYVLLLCLPSALGGPFWLRACLPAKISRRLLRPLPRSSSRPPSFPLLPSDSSSCPLLDGSSPSLA